MTAISTRLAHAGARLLIRHAVVLLLWHATVSPAAAEVVAIRNVTVITGDGGPPLPERSVIVRDGRIAAIVAAGDADAPADARVLDGSGQYLLPGFVDTHAHVALGPVTVKLEDGAPSMHLEPLTAVAEHTARTLLAAGVTLARDPGGPAEVTVAIRRRIAEGDLPGPALQVAGEILDTSRFENLTVQVADAEAVRAEVARQARAGVDWIKLYTGLEPALVETAIDAAHGHGLEVTGHLQATTWSRAAQLGIDSIVHAIPGSAALLPEAARPAYAASMTSTLSMLRWFELVDRDAPVIERMLQSLVNHDVSVDPTLIVFHSMAHGDREEYTRNPALAAMPAALVDNWRRRFNFNVGWAPEDFETARALYPEVEAFVRLLHESGVPLTAGTDANNPWIVPGGSFHTELTLLAQAGIPPLEVLTIATRNGARALGVLDDTGTVEVGKRADLVLLGADPVADIRHTRELVWVMKGGEVWRGDVR